MTGHRAAPPPRCESTVKQTTPKHAQHGLKVCVGHHPSIHPSIHSFINLNTGLSHPMTCIGSFSSIHPSIPLARLPLPPRRRSYTRRYAPALPLPYSLARWLAGSSAFLLGGPDGGFLSYNLWQAAGGICVWVTFGSWPRCGTNPLTKAVVVVVFWG